MIPPLFRRPDPTIAALYGAIVAQGLARNVYAGAADAAVAAPGLAAYVRQAVAQLEEEPFECLRRGTVRFPEPEDLAAAAE